MNYPNPVFLPEVSKKEELYDLISRATFYFSHYNIGIISILVEDKFDQSNINFPDNFDPIIKSKLKFIKNHIQLIPIQNKKELLKVFNNSKWIMKWNHKSSFPFINQLINSNITKKIYYIDKHRDRLEGSAYIQATFDDDNSSDYIKQSSIKFNDFLKKHYGIKKVCLFGTGPSVSEVHNFNFKDVFSIICNTIILDHDLMNHVKPKAIAFGDPIFHFGCSNYASEFRQNLSKAVLKYDLMVFVPLKYYRLLISLVPNIEEKVIGIPNHDKDEINIDLTLHFGVKISHNILTYLMIPLGSTLSNDISIIGCDGRPINEDKYFWSHNKKTQINNKMDTIKLVHPSFFSINYNDYYNEHCDHVNDWIEEGEKKGIVYRSMTPSFIPALKERQQNSQQFSWKLKADSKFLLISLNPDTKDNFGHYLHYDHKLFKAAQKKNGDFISLCHNDFIPQENYFLPTFKFSSDIVATSNSPHHINSFKWDLNNALNNIKVTNSDLPVIIIMYMSSINHLLPILEVMCTLSKNFFFAVNLFHQHKFLYSKSKSDHDLKTINLFKNTIKLRSLLNIKIYTDSNVLQSEILNLTHEKTSLFPMFGTTLLPNDPSIIKTNQLNEFIVYNPSNLQYEKGYDVFAKSASQLSSNHKFSFLARDHFISTTCTSLKKYRDILNDHSILITGILSDDDYVKHITRSDIIVIPYRLNPFKSRTSGILVDAISLGKPVIATEGTWAGEQVKRFNLGETFKDGDHNDLTKAILNTSSNYQKYVSCIKLIHSKWIYNYSADSFLNIILSDYQKNFDNIKNKSSVDFNLFNFNNIKYHVEFTQDNHQTSIRDKIRNPKSKILKTISKILKSNNITHRILKKIIDAILKS